jgi:hypothetical protein
LQYPIHVAAQGVSESAAGWMEETDLMNKQITIKLQLNVFFS